MSVYFNLRHLWTPTGFKRFVHTRVPTGTNQTETHAKMHHLQHTQTPLATSGRFRRPNQPETPRSVGVSPGRRNWQRTTPAENRTEIQDPWRNRPPFPAKPSRIRRGAATGEASAAVSADAGAHPTSQGPARRQGRSNRQRRQRMGLPPLLGRVPAQRAAISPSAFAHIDDQHANHRNPPPWSLLPGIQPRAQERMIGMSRMVSMSQAHHQPCSSRTLPMKP